MLFGEFRRKLFNEFFLHFLFRLLILFNDEYKLFELLSLEIEIDLDLNLDNGINLDTDPDRDLDRDLDRDMETDLDLEHEFNLILL